MFDKVVGKFRIDRAKTSKFTKWDELLGLKAREIRQGELVTPWRWYKIVVLPKTRRLPDLKTFLNVGKDWVP